MALIFNAFQSHQCNKSADPPTWGVAGVLNEQQSKPGFSLPVIWGALTMAAAFLSATADDELLAGQQLEVVH